ncbi:hypothetical protein AAEU29_01635 [Pseudoalteromonas sp. SSM20]|uniref:hypothetical protein n=1 Tax=Pseudoalteromonas sp. SSM20 TaxID=3139394 RepID=UPI003BAC2E96
MFRRLIGLFRSTKKLTSKELLKIASQLKKEKKYEQACETLESALNKNDGELIFLKDRLRLPMYLQLAGRNDEGWKELNRLTLEYTDHLSQCDITNQMRVFLQKEKKFELAFHAYTWNICKQLELYNHHLREIEKSTDYLSKTIYSTKDKTIFGYTDKGNAITDKSYEHFKNKVDSLTSVRSIENILGSTIKKAKLDYCSSEICNYLNRYLTENKTFQATTMRDSLTQIILANRS